ncbi:MAG: peptide chain release factor 2 [Methylotenera sp.]|nr:peptide chain release factor 2 [Methylotenera sp.]MDO9232878.1 peptide chain release factor 2 [Methylotenera sp.]MDO9389110.1 peptide chain release factor 2 [Methylotenera sp.]MDP1596985.1 peptide chain release factor 2 [Methylotenera sp.]MDP1958389.1 peptide chain release factor 2 [Methylotenera sp.]
MEAEQLNIIANRLVDLSERNNALRGYLDIETKSQRLEEVNGLLEDPKVWNDNAKSQALGKEKRELGLIVESLSSLKIGLKDAQELFEMAREENDDDTLLSVAADSEALEKQIADMEFKRMFSQPMDANNCFIEFQSGSGGTEAQDWCNMLLRMYLRYCERKGFKVEVLELSDGDVAGIKGASIKITGDYAYGTLRTENGVHRLVRKSPFDSNAKRHTSFASVQIFPEVDDSIQIDINPADLRIDTYRASGAGGQHINKTDSAVRITHIPTNTVVQCQNDRSQHRNRDEAMSMLKGALYNLELNKRNADKQALEDAKTDIGWGHQIRSYVLDQSRIKDLRTNVEIGNTQGVLDGDLDPFITESLKLGV